MNICFLVILPHDFECTGRSWLLKDSYIFFMEISQLKIKSWPWTTPSVLYCPRQVWARCFSVILMLLNFQQSIKESSPKCGRKIFPPQREGTAILSAILMWHGMLRWLVKDPQTSDCKVNYRVEHLEVKSCGHRWRKLSTFPECIRVKPVSLEAEW